MSDFRQYLRVVSNPPNPWHSSEIEWFGEAPAIDLQVFEDQTKSILSRNDSPDVPFTWSVNPYRGCYHGCAYCYARPTHQYLDFGAGTDFERKLVVKPKAPELLRRAFDRPRWTGKVVAFSGNTDPYQPLEASYKLTRGCLEVCLEYRNPLWIITKSVLIERDIDVLEKLAKEAFVSVSVSIPMFDSAKAKAMEPYVPSPARRFKTIARLARREIPVGVNVCPVIPALTDEDIPAVLEAARESGALYANMTMVRLPGPVQQVFEERLKAAFPLRAERVLRQIADSRDGVMNESRFGRRMRGQGQRWAAIENLFETTRRRLRLPGRPAVPTPSPFRRPREQLLLL